MTSPETFFFKKDFSEGLNQNTKNTKYRRFTTNVIMVNKDD